jgi:hypothetical protein
MNRYSVTLLPALALAFSLIVATAPHGSAVAADAAKDPEVKLDAPSSSKGIRVAVLHVVNATGEVEADRIMEDVLREQFREVDPKKAMFLLPGDVERVLADADALDRAWRVADRWARTGTLDSTAINGLDALLIADAVMCVKVSEWETKRYHNIGEGQSYTTVGLQFVLYNIRDKKKIWSKAVREQRLARELDLSSATIGYDETGRIQTAKANDPPRIAEVASDLVRDALKKFPTK